MYWKAPYRAAKEGLHNNREVTIVICCAMMVLGVIITIISVDIAFRPKPNWYLIGEKVGITIQDNMYTNNVCASAMIQGYIYDAQIGGDKIGLPTPPLDNHKDVAAWMKGCNHGYSIGYGMNANNN